MEEMNLVAPFLLNIPPKVAEKIFQYLFLSDRKNLRWTCKQLYEWCNSDHFCKDEKVIWSENLSSYVNTESDLSRIGRSYYNLLIKDKKLTKASILPFFEKIGTKIHSLVIQNCHLLPGLLDVIITLCDNLSSLNVTLLIESCNIASFFTLEPFSISRPNVTYLKLTLPVEKPSDYFHRMFSIFPNVKQLHVEVLREIYLPYRSFIKIKDLRACFQKTSEECLIIMDEIMKSGTNLESLELNVPLSQSITETNFFGGLPNLKDLSINFNRKTLNDTEKWYPSCSNLVSVKLKALLDFRPPELIRLLTNTGLKHLNVGSDSLTFDEESFEKLLASQLETINFSSVQAIAGLPTTILDSPLEANGTVTNLQLSITKGCTESTLEILLKYFRGLVHLNIYNLTDSILQLIFKYQENLRSLILCDCSGCSVNGFCGSEYSMSNLQKLEHLSLYNVPSKLIKSDELKRAFNLPHLKYLRIDGPVLTDGSCRTSRHAQVPTGLYENLTELRALRLEDAAMPSHETLSSLFSRLKHLNYLRYDMNRPSYSSAVESVTFINTKCGYFSINTEKYKYAFSLGHANYEAKLDRVMILNAALGQTLYFPRISSLDTVQVEWIMA